MEFRVSMQFYRKLVFNRSGSDEATMDLYVPETEEGEKAPVVLWLHQSGFLDPVYRQYAPPILGLTGRGIAVAHVRYRLMGEGYRFPAPVQDVAAAVRFLKANAGQYGLDDQRIGVCGESAGGYLALMLGLAADDAVLMGQPNAEVSCNVQAVCSIYGLVDFLRMDEMAEPGINVIDNSASDSILATFIGGALADNREKAAAASPIHYMPEDAAGLPPFLIFHGTRDPYVPFRQSQLLYDTLQKNGADATFYPIADGDHSMCFLAEYEGVLVDFFVRHLGGSELSGK